MRSFIGLIGVVAMATIIPTTPAFAEGGIGEDGTCFAQIPNGSGGFTGTVFGTSFSRTTKSGVTNYTCRFDLDDAQTPSKHIKTSDFPCLTPAGLADEQRINVSPGGNMTMVCTIRP